MNQIIVTVRAVEVANGGLGSAMALDPGGTDLWLLTDRGPNYDAAADVKAFTVPGFAPRLARFTVDGERLVLTRSIPLHGLDGRPLTGIPNPPGAGGTGESAVDVHGAPIPFDAAGVDPEGLLALRDGSFWVSDEYGPTLIHFGADGRMLRRLSPFGGPCALPAVLAKRRANRGIEGLTGTADGAVLVAALEAPLDNPRAAGRCSRLLRLLWVDTRSCAMRQMVYVLDSPEAVVSDLALVGPDDVLVLESDRKFPGAPTYASTIKRVYRISLAAATDVGDPLNAESGKLFGGRTLEQLPAEGLATHGIVPVTKVLAVDLLPLGYPHDKAEGLAILDRHTIAVSNDDDFGVTDNGAGGIAPKMLPATGAVDRNEVWFVRLPSPLW